MNDWSLVGKWQALAFTAGLGVLVLAVLFCEPGFVPILDGANLAFHEAGHFFYGLLGERFEVYGGTLGQLTIPAIVAAAFWRQRQPTSFATGLVWFFENFFNIARYVGDARAQELPLVGGGGHDWNEILARWNLLTADTRLAIWLRVAGWLGLATAWLWVAWRFRCDQREPDAQ